MAGMGMAEMILQILHMKRREEKAKESDLIPSNVYLCA